MEWAPARLSCWGWAAADVCVSVVDWPDVFIVQQTKTLSRLNGTNGTFPDCYSGRECCGISYVASIHFHIFLSLFPHLKRFAQAAYSSTLSLWKWVQGYNWISLFIKLCQLKSNIFTQSRELCLLSSVHVTQHSLSLRISTHFFVNICYFQTLTLHGQLWEWEPMPGSCCCYGLIWVWVHFWQWVNLFFVLCSSTPMLPHLSRAPPIPTTTPTHSPTHPWS